MTSTIREIFFKWAGRALLVAIPALATSYFSFLSSREESRLKAEATKASAEAGYVTLVAAVDKLQKQVHDNEISLAVLQGRMIPLTLDSTPSRINRRPSTSSLRLGNLSPGLSGSGGGLSGVSNMGSGAKAMEMPAPLPRNLDDAVILQKK